MSSEAVLRMRGYLDSVGNCVHPHPEWVTDCWFCDDIAAIETEAVAAERTRIAAAVRGLPSGVGRVGSRSVSVVDRAAVLAAIDEAMPKP